uniref:Uncharacterized protein n=1 Tax=Manihot esculenta TaxID=3983 RepID=A0A2C9U347_MANES
MQARRLGWDIILSITAVGAEAISAALEQTSPHKAIAARYGVIMAIVSVLLTFADLAFKKYMLIRDKNTRPNNKYHRLRWEFADSLPLYALYNPHFFLPPLQLSEVLRQPSHKHKPIFVLNCKHLGFINLDIESGGILFNNDKPTQFDCPVYQIEQIHPQGV